MIQTGICEMFLRDAAAGLHQEGDDYRCALIRADERGSYGAGLSTFGDVGEDEATGKGYPPGGVRIGRKPTVQDASGVLIDFEHARFERIEVKASGFVIYNATRGGRTVAVQRFHQQRGIAGDLVLRMNQPVRLLRPLKGA